MNVSWHLVIVVYCVILLIASIYSKQYFLSVLFAFFAFLNALMLFKPKEEVPFEARFEGGESIV